MFFPPKIEMLSWGYLLHRASYLGCSITDQLSRVHVGCDAPKLQQDIIEGGYMVEKNSDVSILGRIVLNLWRLLRSEVRKTLMGILLLVVGCWTLK